MSEGFMQHAGILDENENLSLTAKNRIIERLKKSSEEGFAETSPFPCAAGSSVPSATGFLPEDIEDEQKYPEFHENILKTYEKIAKGFNMKSAPNLPFPFCDPSAVALQLGLEPPEFDLAKLPTLTPVSLALTLGIKIPLMDGLIDSFNIPPSLPIPKFDLPEVDLKINLPFPSEFSQKFEFDNWAIKTPEMFVKFTGDLIANVDIPGILDLAAGKPCVIIDKVVESATFGPSEGGDVVKQVVVADLSSFTGECASIAAVGATVGSSPVGATGALGEKYGYKEAQKTEGKKRHSKARNAIIDAFQILYNRPPSLIEAQFSQAIAKLETDYGGTGSFCVPVDTGKLDEKGRKKWKPGALIPESVGCNNWGNIHGSGTAGSFTGYDYDAFSQPYVTSFAKYRTPGEGASAILKELYSQRIYLLKSLKLNNNAWNPVFLMSSTSVLGSNVLKVNEGKKNVPPAKDAVNPKGLTYYAAFPTAYYKNFKAALKEINEEIGEDPTFEFPDPPPGLKFAPHTAKLIGTTMDEINAVVV